MSTLEALMLRATRHVGTASIAAIFSLIAERALLFTKSMMEPAAVTWKVTKWVRELLGWDAAQRWCVAATETELSAEDLQLRADAVTSGTSRKHGHCTVSLRLWSPDSASPRRVAQDGLRVLMIDWSSELSQTGRQAW